MPTAVMVSPAPIKKIKPPAHDAPPPIFDLDKNEQFTDINGDYINVEVRGDRGHDKMWFRAADVETNIHARDIQYEKGLHTSTFDVKLGKRTEPIAFLTYCGVLKAMFSANSPVALRFQRWVTRRMFALHFGTHDDRTELAADVLGIPIGILKTFVHANFSTLQMGRFNDLEARLAHEMKINQQLKQQMDLQEQHRQEIMNMMNTIIQEKSAMVAEKNQRIKELSDMVDMYRSMAEMTSSNSDL